MSSTSDTDELQAEFMREESCLTSVIPAPEAKEKAGFGAPGLPKTAEKESTRGGTGDDSKAGADDAREAEEEQAELESVDEEAESAKVRGEGSSFAKSAGRKVCSASSQIGGMEGRVEEVEEAEMEDVEEEDDEAAGEEVTKGNDGNEAEV